ncbi:hypothetical protein BZG36_05293 [Bifiguratus adelaidae]|uniref:FACT complex subunit POB3 n=1 Tax=Bifiguratus adelaidae TaxID=1938954 RepID=A0A261XTG5_9FUNG|nr:hypothetical protein BZG36_05293 [Bifiguratus adelaidae]
MTDKKQFDFDEIYNGLEPTIGRIRFAPSGLGWRGADQSKPITLSVEDFRKFTWLRVARNFQLRIALKDGKIAKFDNFRREDFEELQRIIRQLYQMQLETKELSIKGWNWGRTEFNGDSLIFNVSNRQMFELPVTQAIGALKSGKNEVTVNFVDPGQPGDQTTTGMSNKDTDELVDITFYIPGTVVKSEADGNDAENSEDDEEELAADAAFYDTVKSKLELGQVTTEHIVQFQDVLCLTPRGRYNIDMFQDSLRLRGKTYDYKVQYSNIIKLFLLLKPDEVNVLFVIGLDPPLRQGQTKYPFLVFQFLRDEEIDAELNMDEETIQTKYEGKLSKTYAAPTYEVISTIFRVLTGRKVTVPGSYRSHHGALAMKCSMKANEGYLYPLEKCFLFIPKPPTFIPISDIGSVTFSRVGNSSVGNSKTFDIKFNMKTGNDFQFSSINREEYQRLDEYLKQKKIKTKSELNEGAQITYRELEDDEEDEDEQDEEDSRKRRRTEAANNVSDDEDEESPDEDFVAEQSDSDVAEEFDSNPESEGENGDED